jgi:hypothetical protein
MLKAQPRCKFMRLGIGELAVYDRWRSIQGQLGGLGGGPWVRHSDLIVNRLRSTCNLHVAYLRRTRIVPAAYLQRTQSLAAAFLRRARIVHAAYLQRARIMPAPYPQRSFALAVAYAKGTLAVTGWERWRVFAVAVA